MVIWNTFKIGALTISVGTPAELSGLVLSDVKFPTGLLSVNVFAARVVQHKSE